MPHSVTAIPTRHPLNAINLTNIHLDDSQVEHPTSRSLYPSFQDEDVAGPPSLTATAAGPCTDGHSLAVDPAANAQQQEQHNRSPPSIVQVPSCGAVPAGPAGHNPADPSHHGQCIQPARLQPQLQPGEEQQQEEEGQGGGPAPAPTPAAAPDPDQDPAPTQSGVAAPGGRPGLHAMEQAAYVAPTAEAEAEAGCLIHEEGQEVGTLPLTCTSLYKKQQSHFVFLSSGLPRLYLQALHRCPLQDDDEDSLDEEEEGAEVAEEKTDGTDMDIAHSMVRAQEGLASFVGIL